jgi:hypothetical protein
MEVLCCSQHRCGRLTCAACAGRYSGRIAKRIAREHPRDPFVTEVDADLTGISAFWTWCAAARNRLDYLRRQDQCWRGVGLTVWLCADDRVRGIVGLGGNPPEWFIEAFGRWCVSLRPISAAAVRTEVTAITRPEMMTRRMPVGGRYQSLKLTIRPARPVGSARLIRRRLHRPHDLAPMPVVL